MIINAQFLWIMWCQTMSNMFFEFCYVSKYFLIFQQFLSKFLCLLASPLCYLQFDVFWFPFCLHSLRRCVRNFLNYAKGQLTVQVKHIKPQPQRWFWSYVRRIIVSIYVCIWMYSINLIIQQSISFCFPTKFETPNSQAIKNRTCSVRFSHFQSSNIHSLAQNCKIWVWYVPSSSSDKIVRIPCSFHDFTIQI